MKKVLVVITTVLAFNLSNAQLLEGDKQLHAIGGIGVGGVGYALGLDLTDGNRDKATAIGIASSFLVGVLKEALDQRIYNQGGGGVGFDWEDVGATVGGGIVGTYAFKFIVNRKDRRQAKRLSQLKAMYND